MSPGVLGRSAERSCCCAVRAAASVSAAVGVGRAVGRAADWRAARAIISERESVRFGVSPSGFGSTFGATVIGAT